MIFGKFIAASGVLALGMLWPFATGQITQVFYEREVALFDSPYITINPIAYERGYFDSKIITEVILHEKKTVIGKEKISSFRIVSNVKHGFFGIEGQSKLSPTEYQSADSTIMATYSDFAFSLLGDANIAIHFTPMESKTREMHIKTAAATFEGNLTQKGQAFFQLKIPKFTIEREQDSLKLEQVVLSGQGKMQEGIWLGHQNLSTESISIDTAMNGSWEILQSNIHFENQFYNSLSHTEKEGAWFIDTLAFITAEQVNKNQESFEAKNIQFGFKIEELDYNSLITMINLDSDLYNKQWVLAQSAFNNLIAKGMKLSFPLDLDLNNGSVHGLLKLIVEQGASQSSNNLDQFFNKIQGNMTLTLPTGFIKEDISLFALLERQGFLEKTKDQIQVNFSVVGKDVVSASGIKIQYMDLLSFILLTAK